MTDNDFLLSHYLLLWEQKVESSNPSTPTFKSRHARLFLFKDNLFFLNDLKIFNY